MDSPRILLVDSYDSFTFNLADLIQRAIPNSVVHTIRNDQYSPERFIELLSSFSAVVVGPGPGSPSNPADVGVLRHLWSIPDALLLPVFGVCLGLQSLCLHFGASIEQLTVVKHGQVSPILHSGNDIFRGVGSAETVRYHSLHAVLPQSDASDSDIVPLAWADDGSENGGRVLMAARHVTKPFWGVQYHPESICTKGGGRDVIQNFWELANTWSRENRRTTLPLPTDWETSPHLDVHPLSHNLDAESGPSSPLLTAAQPRTVRTCTVSYHTQVPTPRICEMLSRSTTSNPANDAEFVLLDSAAAPGRFSIIGIISPSTPRITHHTRDPFVRITSHEDGTNQTLDVDLQGRDIWSWLACYMDERKASGGDSLVPFWGGLIGYMDYEAGVASLDVPLRPDSTRLDGRPNVNLAFVERSIVIDTVDQVMHVQSIACDASNSETGPHPRDVPESEWMESTKRLLQLIVDPAFTPAPSPPRSSHSPYRTEPTSGSRDTLDDNKIQITLPDHASYISKIERAQAYLDAGESYELCLTALTRIVLPSTPPQLDHNLNSNTGWTLFKRLRRLNPAPYSTYIRLSGVTLVGSSPERFLSWSRSGLCQLRPIKGTIRKKRGSSLPDVTFSEASDALLGSTKEIAENLMIVDLIRHELHRVAGSGRVEVTKLFSVEEYETVFQLVTVVQGRVDVEKGYTGWDMLARSLPPGSMTGAPKKRSVQLLQSIEDTPRGVYSGVCGYWCAGGGGDFSVVIRSAFRYDDERREGKDTWYVGAGGAITALSDPEEEWEEMVTKLKSTLQAFTFR